VWTPRRVLLLLGGILFFGGVYGVYARFLGWLDGLPQLPPAMLAKDEDGPAPPVAPVSPTVQRLIEAFGPNCPESRDDKVYETRLEFRTGESSVVLASGPPPANPNSNRVTLTPFSLAVFGKPKPTHLRQPGEAVEISTFHADKAILEFDRLIHSPTDMNKAKLLRLELISEPELAVPDKRRGLVHVTNNQRSADPNRQIVLNTPGPVFYRDPKNVETKPAAGPDIWTDAAIALVDKYNLPRAGAAFAPATAAASGPELRVAAAVPEILLGQRLPPPTVTAVGMRIYLETDDKTPGKPAPKKAQGGTGGVRRIELLERVLFNLWVDPRQGMLSTAGPAANKAAPGQPPVAVVATADPPSATAAVVGGPFVGVQVLSRLNKALLQVETLGPFAYDVEKSLARFDVLPRADTDQPNDVQVYRILPRGGSQELFSQVLEIEFDGPLTGERPKDEVRPAAPKPAAPNPDGGPAFKRLHAWTYTPKRLLTVSSSDRDEYGQNTGGLLAYGQDLVHEQAANYTTLRGAPLHVRRSNPPRPGDKPGVSKPGGTHVLMAGTPDAPATLVMKPDDTPDKAMTATVHGPGRIELFDSGSGGNTVHATWQTSFAQTKEFIQHRELDLYTFTDGAKFEDTSADYWLKGRVLKLWLEGGGKAGGKAGGSQPLPHRLQAVGQVTSHSTDIEVEHADHLNVLFRDGIAPLAPARAATPAPVAAPLPTPVIAKATAGPAPKSAAAPPPEPAKPKPPMRLWARVIDTWVVRYPVPPVPRAAAPADRPGEGSMKYDLEKARCEGPVGTHPIVHQDPDAPEKPRGLDIFGQVLLVDHTPDGSVMTVTGTEQTLAQVHHEGTSILGPKVVIDQLLNRVEVEGRGSLVMPAGSDLNGGELKPPAPPKAGVVAADARPPAEVVVHWRDEMKFSGADRRAEFIGKVRALQGDSYVICHTMQVVFDRPIYFNQVRRPNDPPPKAATPRPATKDGKDANNPKIEIVYCYPAPEEAKDEPAGANVVIYSEVTRDPTGRVAKAQHVTARSLTMKAQERDARGEPYQQVEGEGPGTVRIWQAGQKDAAGPGAPPPPPPAAQPGVARPPTPAPAKEPETEMKLTIVHFGNRMVVKDKAKIYQEGVFYDTIEVIHAPADSPTEQIDKHRLPHGAVRLTCANKLVVSTYRKDPAAPPVQSMYAYGNAYIRSDDYDGWGETVTSDGRFVVLYGSGDALARIYSRFKGNENTGRKITYDRMSGGYGVEGSSGATIQQNAPTSPPKK